MKVLLSGADGQLGGELRRTRPAGVELAAYGRSALDICDRVAVEAAVERDRPDWLVNAAAYTAVDRAEAEPQAAYAVNATGVATLAAAARAAGARLLQVSTDYVFDGARPTPYTPEDGPNPLNVYGASKLEGEHACARILGSEVLVLRGAWLYAAGARNFLTAMLRLLAERDHVDVVIDQVGSPTSAHSFAVAIWAAISAGLRGTWHWSDAGVASWYDFAVAIQNLALEQDLLDIARPIVPIRGALPGRPARRPAYSVLDGAALATRLGLTRRHWSVALRQVLAELGNGPH